MPEWRSRGAAEWDAEPVVHRSFGGDGLQFARLAEELPHAVRAAAAAASGRLRQF
jgi:hypothetical protein